MSENNALAKVTPTSSALAGIDADAVFKLGQVLYESKYFQDVTSASQAIVKILRGQELGIGPIASMENIYVVKGKTALGAALIGAKIKDSGRYDYRVIELTDERCELAFFERGKEIGRSKFDMDDAKKAGLTGGDNSNYKKFPRNMLLARAVSNGAKWYCPDVFGGPIYTPEELKGIAEPELAIEPHTVEKNGQSVNTTTGEITEQQPAKSKLRRDKEAGYQMMHAKYGDILDIPPLNPEWTDEELEGTGAHWKQQIIDYSKQVSADAIPA